MKNVMSKTAAMNVAKKEVHTVSGNWYAGHSYTSNKEAMTARRIDLVTTALVNMFDMYWSEAAYVVEENRYYIHNVKDLYEASIKVLDSK